MPIRTLALLLVPLLLLASTKAFAGDDDAAALKRHIEVLVHESRAMKAEGRRDAADVLLKRAHELKARLAERAQAEEGVPLTMAQAEKVLHGLEMGMESLKILRREQELKALAQVANAVRERMQKARATKRDEHPEIQEARRQLEILRVAFHGLREGEKREAMERMEHAIHVLELDIAGRRDEEAQEIRKRGPDRGERIELLRLAAKLWDGFGHEGKARTIRELAEQMAGQASDRRPEAREREERLEMLQHQIHELRQAVERLEEHVRMLHHRLDEDE